MIASNSLWVIKLGPFQVFRGDITILNVDEAHSKMSPQESRKISAVTPEHIDAVRNLKVEYSHTTYSEIGASFGISMTCMRSILHVVLVT